MLELLVGMDATRRVTKQAVALERTGRRRPPRAGRSRPSAARAFVFDAVLGLASPAVGARAPSSARRAFREARAD